MCDYYYKPLDHHSVEVHGNKEANKFHAICLDCNVYLLIQGTEEDAQNAKVRHDSVFQELAAMEPFNKFMPRCACYSDYLDTLDETGLDAEIELSCEVEEFIEARKSDGITEEVHAATMLEVELALNPTSLKDAKEIYRIELVNLL